MRIALLCTALLLPLSILAADVIVDTDDLLAAAKNNMERMKKETATWTVEISSDTSATVLVETVQAPTMRRIVLSFKKDPDTTAVPVITIIERENKWYVDELVGVSGVYRPGEAPFHASMSSLLLSDDLHWVTAETLPQLGTPVEQVGDVVTYQAKIAESAANSMKEQLGKASVLNSRFGTTTNRSIQIDVLRRLVNDGVIKKVNLKIGAIVECGTYKRMATFRDFKFLPGPNDDFFKVAGQHWEDHTAALTTEDLSNSILISHNQLETSVDKGGIPELELWNLKTSELRRVPAIAMALRSGTFQRDRSRIIALGISFEKGGTFPFEVDFQSGANRIIGDFHRGSVVIAPVVSHDGKTLALLHQELFETDIHVYLIDIKSNVATKLGEPQGLFGLSWLPDDKGLIVSKRIARNKTEPSIETLCKMDLDGKLTDIRDGKNPLVLSDGNSILFEDKGRAWHVCDMDGKILKDITSGKLHYEFQSLNPTGEKVLGVRRGKSDELSEPVQLDPKTGVIQPITPLPPGLITNVIGQ